MSYQRVETIGDCTLYLGDCCELVKSIADRVDALVTDNPYGCNFNTDSTRFSGGEHQGVRRGQGRKDREIPGDSEPFDPQPWLRFPEVIFWGSNHFAQRLPIGRTLIWLKKQPRH
ncbi:MAG: hypothetical protein AAGF48_16030 [Pseudomonadota bacterium]